MSAPIDNPTDTTEPQGSDYQVSQETQSPEFSKGKPRVLPGSRARDTGAKPRDTAPRARRTRKATEDKTAGPAKEKSIDAPEYVPGRIGEALAGTYAQIGMMWGMFDPQCAQVLISNSKSMADSMEKWAKESPAVRGVLEKLITTSVIGEVIAAHAPIVMAIGMHHVPALRNKMGQGAGVPGNSGMPGTPDNGDSSEQRAA